jgi:hypothetical protein
MPKKEQSPEPEQKMASFRLPVRTLADLDTIAAALTAATGTDHNRTDALKSIAHREAMRVRSRAAKNSADGS